MSQAQTTRYANELAEFTRKFHLKPSESPSDTPIYRVRLDTQVIRGTLTASRATVVPLTPFEPVNVIAHYSGCFWTRSIEGQMAKMHGPAPSRYDIKWPSNVTPYEVFSKRNPVIDDMWVHQLIDIIRVETETGRLRKMQHTYVFVAIHANHLQTTPTEQYKDASEFLARSMNKLARALFIEVIFVGMTVDPNPESPVNVDLFLGYLYSELSNPKYYNFVKFYDIMTLRSEGTVYETSNSYEVRTRVERPAYVEAHALGKFPQLIHALLLHGMRF